MTEPAYRSRLSLFGKETVYRAMPDAMHWQNERGSGEIRFADVRQIRIYRMPGFEMTPDYGRCIVKPVSGRAIVISSNHFLGLGNFESRMDQMVPFVKGLAERAALANPAISFLRGMPLALWWVFGLVLVASVVFGVVGLIMIAVMLVRGEPMSFGLLFSFAICLGTVISVVPLARWLQRSRPRHFDPSDVEQALL